MFKGGRVISILTDFGVRDAYVGIMKGVIFSICPTARIIDISHEVSRHSILQGAFMLAQTAPYFPEGSIHLVVVDPGVGTDRKRIILQGKRCLYVGPDNGVLSLAAKRESVIQAVEIKNEERMLPHPSETFEGRDVFAPAAAYLARGVDITDFGPNISDFESLSLAEPSQSDNCLLGEVIYIDGFGNVVTNIPKEMLQDICLGASFKVRVQEVSKIAPFCEAYDYVPVGSPLLVVGSSGFLEIAVNRGSAERLFKAKTGDRVAVTV